MLEIKAPSDGIVKDLAVTTKGAVVGAGGLILNIIPQDEPLQAEVALRNEDVGFVVPGQVVQVKIAAYPFQRYGLMPGKVLMVSADAGDSRSASGPNVGQTPNAAPSPLSYKAIVTLDRKNLLSESLNQELPLSAGMLVVAEIHQRQRTVMEYLLSPVQKVRQEAARERS